MKPLLYTSLLLLASLTYAQNTGRGGKNNVVIKLPALFGSGPNTRVIVLPDPSNNRGSSIRWSGEAGGPVAVDNKVTRRLEPPNTPRVQSRPIVNPAGQPFIPQTPRQVQSEFPPQETPVPSTRYQEYNQNSRQTTNRQNQQQNQRNTNQQNQNQQNKNQQVQQQETNRQNTRQTSNRQNGVSPPANTPRPRLPNDSIFFNPEPPTRETPAVNPQNNGQTGNNQPGQSGNPSAVRNRPNFVPAARLYVPTENGGVSNPPGNQGSNQGQTSPGPVNNGGNVPPPPQNNLSPRGASPKPNAPNKIQYVGNLDVGSVPAVNPNTLAGNAPASRTTGNQPPQNSFQQRNVPRPAQTNRTPSMSEIDRWMAANFPELINRKTGLPASPSLRNIRTRIETMTAGQDVNPNTAAPNTAAQAPPPTNQNVQQPPAPPKSPQTPSTTNQQTINSRVQGNQQQINRLPSRTQLGNRAPPTRKETINSRVQGNQQQNNRLPSGTQLGNRAPPTRKETINSRVQGNQQQNNRLPSGTQLGNRAPPTRTNPPVDAPTVNKPAVQTMPPINTVQRETLNPNQQTEFNPNVNQLQGRTNRPGANENVANQGPNVIPDGFTGNRNNLRNPNPPQVQSVPQDRNQFRPNNMPGGAQNFNNAGNPARNPNFGNLATNPRTNQGLQQVTNPRAEPPSPADGNLRQQFLPRGGGGVGGFNSAWLAGNPNPGAQGQMNLDMFNLFNRLPGSQDVPPQAFPVLPGNRGGMILPNPALLNTRPPMIPEATETPEIEAGGVPEVESNPAPNINPGLQNWLGGIGNPLFQNPNAGGLNGPLGPNGRANTPNPRGGNWFDQLPSLPGWSNRRIDSFQQQSAVNTPNPPFQRQAPPNVDNLNNGRIIPPRPQFPNGQIRIPVQPRNQNIPITPNQQAGPDQSGSANQVRSRANQSNTPPKQPRNPQVQPAWRPPTPVQPKPTNPPPRQTQSQVTSTPAPKPAPGLWKPLVNQGTRNNVNQPSTLVNGNQNTLNQRTSGGSNQQTNRPGQQPAVDNLNPATRQPAWRSPVSGQQQRGGNTNPANPGQRQGLNAMGLFPNPNARGNPGTAGMPPHMANFAIHHRLLDQACGPSKIAQQNYQRQMMAFMGAQSRQRQAQMAMFQRQPGAAGQNPLFAQGPAGVLPNPLANPRTRRKRQSPMFFNMPGMSPTPGMQQMPGMAQRPGMEQFQGMPPMPGMPPMSGMSPMAGMMPMVAPESPEINYQCSMSESCGMTTSERAQTVHRSPQSERDCQSRKTGLLCCLG